MRMLLSAAIIVDSGTSNRKPGRPTTGACLAIAIGLLTGCDASYSRRALDSSPFIVFESSAQAYQLPQPVLNRAQAIQFAQGKEEFERRWVPFPSIGGQWGRGPLSNSDSCASCHRANGRGSTDMSDDGVPPSLLVRLGLPGTHGSMPDPVYGLQLNTQGLLGRVPAEGQVQVRWREHRVVLHDGEVVALRSPELELTDLAYGSLANAARMSLRIAPQLVGLGLLAGVTEKEIDSLRSAQRALGLEGRINRVWDRRASTFVAGRFGWKASQPNLLQQAASAFIEDIGVTSFIFLAENCSAAQTECGRTQTAVHPEVKNEQLVALTAYLQGLAVPASREYAARGSRLFSKLQCDACHVRSIRTTLGGTATIHPYTDLMLHDMGEALADEVREFDARGDEWRTPPLWGLGLLGRVGGGSHLMHDGRARDVQEAILWHAGAARKSRDSYLQLAREDRAILLHFLQAL